MNTELETEMVLDADKSRGINQPGLTQGIEYIDCNGNTRLKYETLQTYTSTTIQEMKDAVEESEESEDKLQDEIESEVETEIEKIIEPEPEVKPKPTPKKRVTKPKTVKKDS